MNLTLKRLLTCIALIILGLIFGYFFIYEKLEAMKLGHEITFSYKAIVLVPMMLSMGLYFLFFRIYNNGYFKDLTPQDKTIFVFAMVFMAILVIATVVWFYWPMTKFGYE